MLEEDNDIIKHAVSYIIMADIFMKGKELFKKKQQRITSVVSVSQEKDWDAFCVLKNPSQKHKTETTLTWQDAGPRPTSAV